MATEDKCTPVPPSLCFAVRFLLAGPGSIFSELLGGPWNTTLAAAHPIRIKWSLRDSLNTDKLFVNGARREKERERERERGRGKKSLSSFVSFCIPMSCQPANNSSRISSLIHQKENEERLHGEGNTLHWLFSELLKETICFPALFVPIQSYSPVWCRCENDYLIIEVRER